MEFWKPHRNRGSEWVLASISRAVNIVLQALQLHKLRVCRKIQAGENVSHDRCNTTFMENLLNIGAELLIRRVRKIAKGTISFAMSVGLHGATRLTLDRFSRNLIHECLPNICRENFSLIKIRQE
jgi:hypothetical protein